MTTSGTPSRAISTACAWRSWCGAKRRRTPADTARWRRVEVLPSPGIHADLTAAAALAASDEDAAPGGIEVAFGERQRLVDPQTRAPEQHDQRSGAQTRWSIAGSAHDGHDLLDGGRVGRVASPFVAWRAAAVKAGHGRRRLAATSGIKKL
jgi:hypothetical protein